MVLGAMLGVIGIVRIAVWQKLGFYDYGAHWMLVGADGRRGAGRHRHVRLAVRLDAAVLLQRLGFDPASASAPFVATLVDVTGLVIYFSVASLILRGTLL